MRISMRIYVAFSVHMDTYQTSAQKVTCDISPVDSQFRTPLHWASVLGLSEVVRMLMDKGANPLITDSISATALHYTVIGECSQCVMD